MIYITLGSMLGCFMGIYNYISPFIFALFLVFGFNFLDYVLNKFILKYEKEILCFEKKNGIETETETKIETETEIKKQKYENEEVNEEINEEVSVEKNKKIINLNYRIYYLNLLKKYLFVSNSKEILIFILFFIIFYFNCVIRLENINHIKEFGGDKKNIYFLVLKKEDLEYSKKYNVLVYKISELEEGKFASVNIMVTLFSKKELEIGNKYSINSTFEEYDENFNKGGFNSKLYNYSKNNYFKIAGGNFKIDSEKDFNLNGYLSFLVFISKYKEKVSLDFNKYVNNNLLIGVLLGDVKDLDKDMKEAFKEVNIYHMLSVSGSHITYILLFLTFSLNLLKFDKRLKLIALFFILLIFSFLVDNTPSVVRASLMSLIFVYFRGKDRNIGYADALLLTLFVNLLINPFQILNLGMYLSYLGAFAIWMVMQTIGKAFGFEWLIWKIGIEEKKNWRYLEKEEHRKRKKEEFLEEKIIEKSRDSIVLSNGFVNIKKNLYIKVCSNIMLRIRRIFENLKKIKFKDILKKILHFIFETIITGVSVQLVIWPIIAKNWYTISLNFLIANILTTTALGIVVMLGFIMLIFSAFNFEKIFIIKWLYILFSFFINRLLDYTEYVVEITRKIPDSIVYITPPSYLFLFVYYFLIYFLVMTVYIYNLEINKKQYKLNKKEFVEEEIEENRKIIEKKKKYIFRKYMKYEKRMNEKKE